MIRAKRRPARARSSRTAPRLWNWNASGRRSSLIRVPTPAPVIGATLAMMRNTSAKASVTSAKYEPLQPGAEAQRADHGADQRAGGDPDAEAEPGVDAVAHLQDGGHIGAGAEECRVAERILPAIAAEQVPALADQRDQERHHQKIEHDIGRGDQRHGREQRHGDAAIGDQSPHARSPNKPLGRNSSTRMNITNMPICPSDSPR